MKIAATIFLLLIAFFTTEPLISSAYGTKGMCTDKGCGENDGCAGARKQNKNDCNRPCNPFMYCSVCSYLQSEQTSVLPQAFTIISLKYCLMNDGPILNYQGECWHPPEVV